MSIKTTYSTKDKTSR